ncbi:PhzF family phenazine biosynthesis protein [Rhodococcus oryzae]|uniref:PhzF family phenazine biosynthesis protein n=1 Tax=Rhodococcus oryzae TaxID=2571143 RepID=A0ABY2RFH7_9NOCA|nr:PhzF family phenazine biosynthesis protein [Rhodococcus oryzae]TJZ75411.1 PhzF family phenazine biosynthesis protein [Rhodococcus oryzae]
MSIEVDVVRVFTDANGHHGNALGIVDAALVPAERRQGLAAELGFSETIFVELPGPGAASARAQIFTPATELPFAGHPTVGLSWWLRERGAAVDVLEVPAGPVTTYVDHGMTWVRAKPDWAPEFTLHPKPDSAAVVSTRADSFESGHHYVWAWAGEGAIRSRMFAPLMGIPEDEATGAAAVRITEHLRRSLHITQGRGSQIYTVYARDGWVDVGGRVHPDRTLSV